jgi:hypothetical protein
MATATPSLDPERTAVVLIEFQASNDCHIRLCDPRLGGGRPLQGPRATERRRSVALLGSGSASGHQVAGGPHSRQRPSPA